MFFCPSVFSDYINISECTEINNSFLGVVDEVRLNESFNSTNNICFPINEVDNFTFDCNNNTINSSIETFTILFDLENVNNVIVRNCDAYNFNRAFIAGSSNNVTIESFTGEYSGPFFSSSSYLSNFLFSNLLLSSDSGISMSSYFDNFSLSNVKVGYILFRGNNIGESANLLIKNSNITNHITIYQMITAPRVITNIEIINSSMDNLNLIGDLRNFSLYNSIIYEEVSFDSAGTLTEPYPSDVIFTENYFYSIINSTNWSSTDVYFSGNYFNISLINSSGCIYEAMPLSFCDLAWNELIITTNQISNTQTSSLFPLSSLSSLFVIIFLLLGFFFY